MLVSMSSRKSKAKAKPQQQQRKIANNNNNSPSSSAVSKGISKKSGNSSANNNNHNLRDDASATSAGYLISCDVPTKQFIQYLDELKPVDKKFIIQVLDSTHLLVKLSCKEEIEKKVEDWLDENIFSAIEKVGEDLDMS